MFFTFPKDAHWTDRQAVEFGVEIGEYRGGLSALRLTRGRYRVSFFASTAPSAPTTPSRLCS